MQAWAFASRTMRAWQQAEQPPSECFQEAVTKEEKEKRAGTRAFWRIVPRTCSTIVCLPCALSCNHQECTGPCSIQGHAFPTASKVNMDNIPQSVIVEIPEAILQKQTKRLHLHVNETRVNKAFQRWQNNPTRVTSRTKYLKKSFPCPLSAIISHAALQGVQQPGVFQARRVFGSAGELQSVSGVISHGLRR